MARRFASTERINRDYNRLIGLTGTRRRENAPQQLRMGDVPFDESISGCVR